MASNEILTIELVRARMINAKREKEACTESVHVKLGDVAALEAAAKKFGRFDHWEGQETALKSLLDILEK